MLDVSGLQAAYGSSQVLFDVSLRVAAGEVVTLLGRNGMGKTTTVRAIMGLTRPRGGTVRFGGLSIAGHTPEVVARRGIGLVPEGRHIFPTLTVTENLVATARGGRGARWTLPAVFAHFPRLQERRGQLARTLSGGEQQMLAIGRALMTNPMLLILDEATEGLAPVIRSEIWSMIRVLKAEGLAILLIDKNLAVLKQLADRHYALQKGRTVWSGDSAALAADAVVVQGFIGL
jgi:branched-chain amino acid transport system ATP-binding protein